MNTTQTTTTADQTANKQPIPVNAFIVHRNAHWDEYCAIVLLRTYGQQAFPGILQAPVRFIEADIFGTDAEFDASGIIPIGCARARFDEHRGMNGEKERIPGECATTLVAKYLGITDRPELKQFIEDALYFDTHAGISPTQMPELVKVMHRFGGSRKEQDVMVWAFTAINAIISQEKFHYAAMANEKSLLAMFKAATDQGFFADDPRAHQNMFNRIHDSMKRKDMCSAQLAHVVEALHRLPADLKEIEGWLDMALNAMNADQLDFLDQVDLLKKNSSIEVRALLGNQECSLGLMVCSGDNQNLPKAARYLKNQLVLIRKSSGNVQIFTDTSIDGLNLANAARMIRFLELPKEKKATTDWRGLGCEGRHPDVGNWHYFKKGEMIFNGNDTHKLPPTEISNQALVEILKYAFHPRYLSKWCSQRGIRLNNQQSSDAVQKATEELVEVSSK
jgi:hypothetical protein